MAKISSLVKKKQWIKIVSPKDFGENEMGETFISEPEQAIGKTLLVSLANITGDYQKQNINIKFRITGHDNGRLTTVFNGYFITPSAVRKLMRKSRDKLDDSFLVKTSEGIQLRIKTIMITKSRTKGGILAALKKQAREVMATIVGSMNLETVAREISMHRIQQNLSKELKKLYPLSVCEIRTAELSNEDKKSEVPSPSAAEATAMPEKAAV